MNQTHQIQPTSLTAYFEEILPTLGKRHKEVLKVLIRHQDLSNMELGEELGWSINRVTPRVKELRDKDIVVFSQYRKCRITGRRVIAWKYKKLYRESKPVNSFIPTSPSKTEQPRSLF